MAHARLLPIVCLCLSALIGCQRACGGSPSRGDAVAEAIRKGDVDALGKALEEEKDQTASREVKVDVEQLRKERPLVEWVSIVVKRNQLLGVRFLKLDSQMCPRSRDASVAPAPKSLKEALGQTVDVTQDLWNEVGLHRIRGTPLHLAAFFCQASMIELLVEKGANPNAPDDLGLTPLHWASCEQAVTALVKAKAEVNAASRDGWTPLHLAATAPIVRVLVAHGARVDARDGCGNQPLHTAAYFGLRATRGAARAPDAGRVVLTDEDPQWLRLLARLVEEVGENLHHLGALLDVQGALREAGAELEAVNAVGTAPHAIVSGGGGDFDD